MVKQNVALVTGANRGIGFGLCEALLKQDYTVLMLGKRSKAVEQSAQNLNSDRAIPLVFDLNNLEEIPLLLESVQNYTSHLNILINNAGILPGPKIGADDPLLQQNSISVPEKQSQFHSAFTVNSLAPYYLSHALLPLLKKSPHANVVNVSSRMGQIDSMQANYAAYRVSKTALNAITSILAQDFKSYSINVNCISPGWVRTDMGSPYADRSVEEAIPGILWAAQLPKGGPTGHFFADGKKIAW
ncbi:SDR family NAD(P)-dependent oxidoreductase [bacterium]|nr:SDR family NAD(P)-dependent oxidoreductase [bacterium]